MPVGGTQLGMPMQTREHTSGQSGAPSSALNYPYQTSVISADGLSARLKPDLSHPLIGDRNFAKDQPEIQCRTRA